MAFFDKPKYTPKKQPEDLLEPQTDAEYMEAKQTCRPYEILDLPFEEIREIAKRSSNADCLILMDSPAGMKIHFVK